MLSVKLRLIFYIYVLKNMTWPEKVQDEDNRYMVGIISRIWYKCFNIDQEVMPNSLDIFRYMEWFLEGVRQLSFLYFDQVLWMFIIPQCWPGFMGVHHSPVLN